MIFLNAHSPDDLYREQAKRLIASCATFGLDLRVYEYLDLGSWQANAQYKAYFLFKMRQAFDGPLVWLDADAEIVRFPGLFFELAGEAESDKSRVTSDESPATRVTRHSSPVTDIDFAGHWLGDRELLSGTLWLGDTPACSELLARWVEENHRVPDGRYGDQGNLERIVLDRPNLRQVRLPPEYAYIHDISRRMYPAVEPVIIHWQASRRARAR